MGYLKIISHPHLMTKITTTITGTTSHDKIGFCFVFIEEYFNCYTSHAYDVIHDMFKHFSDFREAVW